MDTISLSDAVETDTILIDSREPWEKMYEYLIDMGALDNYDFEKVKLNHKADFVVGQDDRVAIQRKEINDFRRSLDTLKDDLLELRCNYPYSALLIEGRWKTDGRTIKLRRGGVWVETATVEEFHRFWFSQQLRGTMYCQTMSTRETCALLMNMHGYLDGSVQTENTQESPVTVLTMFPNIGPERAAKLVEFFGDVQAALINVRNWETVDGIGPVTQESVNEWVAGNDG